MLIINADDWGRSTAETDVELECFRAGRITSVSAMVFMQDSERAANLANEHGVDTGLHLNFNQNFDGRVSAAARAAHERLVRFMNAAKYSRLVFHPGLTQCFRDVYQAQRDEFHRLYGKAPTHLDGHQHRHLCPNMILSDILPAGEIIRRNFTFLPGEKSIFNRKFRAMFDRWIARRHPITNYLFNLVQCLEPKKFEQVATLAKTYSVELETHPIKENERRFLLSPNFPELLRGARLAPYAALQSAGGGSTQLTQPLAAI